MLARFMDWTELGACPSCRGRLERAEQAYACASCGARWPIVAGVPRFVDSQHYVGSFGYEWTRHAHTQLDDARSRESERVFAEKTGLTPEAVKGKLVLDVGVGTGRFADVVARWGGTPVGVDLSLAVLSARANLARYPEARVAQADLFNLPFREETFDVVYSIGVLHHTPSTQEAFRTVARFLKPGGVAAIGIYEASPIYEYSDRYRRYTTALSHSLLHFLSHAAIAAPHVVRLAKTLAGSVAEQRVYEAVLSSRHANPQWRVLDTFDWYSPRYQWLHTEAEVKSWFHELGFEDVRRLPEETMVSVRGRRPAGSLRDPGPLTPPRHGALAPLPSWVPAGGPARQGVLVALLLGEVVRAFARSGGAIARDRRDRAIQLLTQAVVATKRSLGMSVAG